jgi:hypothetical protein
MPLSNGMFMPRRPVAAAREGSAGAAAKTQSPAIPSVRTSSLVSAQSCRNAPISFCISSMALASSVRGDRQGPKQSYRTAVGKRDRSLETTSIGLFSPPKAGENESIVRIKSSENNGIIFISYPKMRLALHPRSILVTFLLQ